MLSSSVATSSIDGFFPFSTPSTVSFDGLRINRHFLHSSYPSCRNHSLLAAKSPVVAPNSSNCLVLGDAEELSVEVYNRRIRDCCRVGDIDEAMVLLSQMEAKGLIPSPLSYSYLVESLGTLGRNLEAELLFVEMLSLGIKPQLRLFNTLLRGFLRKGQLGLASRLLAVMDDYRIPRNRESYEILLDYHVNAGRLEDTWSIINEMRHLGFQLNSFVYSRVIGIYRDNGMWKKAMGVVRDIMEMGMIPDHHIYNAVIDTFGKHGELSEALEAFEKMKQEGVAPNVNTWNSLICWHCKAGDLRTAVELLTSMQAQGLCPDPKIFTTIISRLGEQGKWDLIRENFEYMKDTGHGKNGAIYAVLVDIYGQYGRFQDAKECISALKSEGVQPSASIYCLLANAYAQQVVHLLLFFTLITAK